MRHPTRILWLLAMAATLLVALAVVRWDGAKANAPTTLVGASSARVAAPSGGPVLRLAGAQSTARQVALNAQEDVILSVVRDCTPVVLEDGSLWAQATISSLVPLSAVTVFEDAGTPEVFEDDVPLGVIEGDLDLDGILDPGEFWIAGAAYIPAAGAVVDTIYASGTDEAGGVIRGFAACDLAPAAPPVTDPPPEPAGETVVPTATTTTTFDAVSEGEFEAAAASSPTIDKVSDSEAIVSGNEIGFTIDVENPGTEPLYAVEIEDHLPSNADLDWSFEILAGEGSCAIVTGVGELILECALGTLDPAEQFTVRIFTDTTVGVCDAVVNEAIVRWSFVNGGSPTEVIQTPAAVIKVTCPPLIVEKEARDAEISAGEDAIFDVTLTVTEDAFDVFLNDPWPDAGAWVMEPFLTGCEDSGSSLDCSFGDLTAPQEITFSVSRPTDVEDCGAELTNTVHVEELSGGAFAAAADTDADDDEATIFVVCPDLRVQQGPDGVILNSGDTGIFLVQVFNEGEGDAFDVAMTNFLSPGIEWTIEEEVEGCAVVEGEDGPELQCNFGTIPAGESVSVSFTGETDADDCSEFHLNNAEVSASNEPSSADENNFASVQFSVRCPSLRVEKTPLPSDTISAGSTAEFLIVVANDGSGSASDVTVTDELPNGVEWVVADVVPSFGEADVSCEIGPGSESDLELSCAFAFIPPVESVEVYVDGVTDPADCAAPLENVASASASNEPDQSDFSAAAESGVATITVLCPNLSLTKIASDSEVSAGEPVSFTIEAANAGPGVGFGLELNDSLPSGVEWEIVSESPGCSTGEGALSCDIGNLGVAETFSVTIEGTPGPDSCGDLTNSAFLDALNDDGTVTTDPVTVTVLCPELRLVKSTESADVTAGQLASYSIQVFNDGLGDAFDVTLTDALPAGVTWSVVDEPACTIEENELTCDVGTIAGGDGISFAVTVEGATDAADCGATLTNSASASASNHGSVTSEPVSITVSCPTLVVDKIAADGVISAGEPASFSITVSNTGDGEATGVVLTDTLPAGVTWTENPETDCTLTGLELSCDVGTLGPLGSGTNDFSVTVEGATDADDCGTLENESVADAENTEPAISGLATIDVNCPVLTIAKEAGGDVSAGETASFTVTVANDGLGTALGVSVRDELPDGIDWIASNEQCGIDGSILFCSFGDLETDESASVTVSGATDVEDCGEITNTATVSADNHLDVESAAATITVNCAELLITKDAADAEISAGETASYTFTVSNVGAGTATDVTVEDTVPAGIAWTDDSDDCDFDGPTLFCDFGDIGSTDEASVTISGTTGPEDCGEISNTATADSAVTDPVTSSPATISILCPGVAVTKVADAEAVAAGDAIGFTLTVTNPRVANALGVSLVDELPTTAGLSWAIDGGADADDCEIDDGVLSCDFGTLPGAQSRVVHITSPTTAESCGTIENTATVEADNEPADLGDNNTATATIAVDCASIAVVKIATDGLGTEIATADVGDTITYLYFVANTGGVPLTDVAVLDDHFPVEGNLCPAGTTLEPDDGIPGSGADEIVCAVEYLVGEIDITDADGLTLTNLATASGVSPLGDEVTGTDDATVTINEPKEPCQFPVTFTFATPIDFVDDEGNVLFTIPAGITFFFEPGEVNDAGGCTMPFTIAGTPAGVPVLARGTMSISIEIGGQAAVRALVTDARLLVEVTEVTAWAVPGVPAPQPEVEEVRATIVVSGPVLEIEAGEAKAVIMVEPELEVPFVQTEAYTISTPTPPNTGAGVTASMQSGAGAFVGLATMLPIIAAAAIRRRRPFARWPMGDG